MEQTSHLLGVHSNSAEATKYDTRPPAYQKQAVKDNLATQAGDDTVNNNTDAEIMTHFHVVRNTSNSWQHLPTSVLLLIRIQRKYPLRFFSPVLHYAPRHKGI